MENIGIDIAIDIVASSTIDIAIAIANFKARQLLLPLL